VHETGDKRAALLAPIAETLKENDACVFVCIVCCIHTGLERVHETGDKRAALLAPISETLKENDACVFVCVACCIHTGLERVHETGDKRAALLAPIAETLKETMHVCLCVLCVASTQAWSACTRRGTGVLLCWLP